VLDRDGCSNKCALPGGHLLITEVAVSPTEAEFIEIFNPSKTTIALDTVYLADRIDFHQLPGGALKTGRFDFIARFPNGATLKPGAYAVVALDGLKFKVVFNKPPDYELFATDAAIPDMVEPHKGLFGSTAGLTDTGEVLTAFSWDGKSDRVQDLDYVVWKGSTATAVFRTVSTCVDGPDINATTSCYKNDTPVTQQSSIVPPQTGGSMQRCNYLETGEKKSGGNGVGGHDETSESFSGAGATWKRNPNTPTDRTPHRGAPLGFCPQ